MNNAERLLGLELKRVGRQLVGGYYLDGERHPWRRDKLKVFIWHGGVYVQEEGGRTISLPTWLIEFGGARDYGEALKMINGRSQVLHWDRAEMMRTKETVRYVSADIVTAAKGYDLRGCPLFRWFCTMFDEEKVREAWERYNVTTDGKGLAVFWSVDQYGHILHDKRMRYGEDGHRDKNFGGTRQYKTADGYSGRCFFGAHLIQQSEGDILVVESEKTALMLYLVTGKVAVATAGKNNLRDKDSRFLCFPDKDAFEEWENSGNRCVRWFEGWELPLELQPRTADVLDMLEWRFKNGKGLYL